MPGDTTRDRCLRFICGLLTSRHNISLALVLPIIGHIAPEGGCAIGQIHLSGSAQRELALIGGPDLGGSVVTVATKEAKTQEEKQAGWRRKAAQKGFGDSWKLLNTSEHELREATTGLYHPDQIDDLVELLKALRVLYSQAAIGALLQAEGSFVDAKDPEARRRSRSRKLTTGRSPWLWASTSAPSPVMVGRVSSYRCRMPCRRSRARQSR